MPAVADLTDAIREYNRLSEANVGGRIGHTPEAWDAVAARIDAALERSGLTGDRRTFAADRAQDARSNSQAFRARAKSGARSRG